MSDTTDLRDLDMQIAKALRVSVYYDEKDKDWWERIEGAARRLTHYTIILDSAVTLPLKEDWKLEITIFPDDMPHATIYEYVDGLWGVRYHEQEETAALAVCKTWLAWHEATQKTNAGSLLSDEG